MYRERERGRERERERESERRSNHMSCRLDSLWHLIRLKSGLICGPSYNVYSKTQTISQTWPSWLLWPGPSGPQWAGRVRLLGASGCTLHAGTCNNSDSAREWHRNTQIMPFHQQSEKNRACRPQVEVKTVPKFYPFRHFLCDVGPPSLRAGSGIEISDQNDPPNTPNHQNIYILIRAM